MDFNPDYPVALTAIRNDSLNILAQLMATDLTPQQASLLISLKRILSSLEISAFQEGRHSISEELDEILSDEIPQGMEEVCQNTRFFQALHRLKVDILSSPEKEVAATKGYSQVGLN
jgi:DnaJ-domain-containing protein 1